MKIREGFCPYCGSSNVDDVSDYPQHDSYIYEVECVDCGGYFKEIFSFVFESQTFYQNTETINILKDHDNPNK